MHTQIDTLLDNIRLENTGVPIYVQLRDQVLQALGAGRLNSGEQMPTMRQVAVALKIDLNTVRHAYDELERIGAVTLVRGRGSFVATPPPQADTATRTAAIDQLAKQTIATAAAMGLDPLAVAERIAALAQQQQPKETKP